MSYAVTEWGLPKTILLNSTCEKCSRPIADFEVRETRSTAMQTVIAYRCNAIETAHFHCGHCRFLCPFCGTFFAPTTANLRRHINTHFPESALLNSSADRAQPTGFNTCSYCPFSFQNMTIEARYEHALSHFVSAIESLEAEEGQHDEEYEYLSQRDLPPQHSLYHGDELQ